MIVVICDAALGSLIRLYDHTTGGSIEKIHNIMTKATPEILILGSSRASHHYDTELIKDSLDMTVFNAGLDGRGTTSSYCILKGVSRRSFPKVIICEVSPLFDIYEDSGSLRMSDFYPYIECDDIKSVIIDFDPTEQYKLQSNSYRFNSTILRLLHSVVIQRDSYHNGYVPLNGKLKPAKRKVKANAAAPNRIDATKEKYLRRLIEESSAQNCKIVFVVSPVFQGRSTAEYYEPEFNIIKDYGLPILNHLNDGGFINDPTLFQDYTHLNKDGAYKFTEIIISEIRPIVQED